jgi:hypothetical protein
MYGGKLVAAMDRQHPHDLFDVLQLYAHEGVTTGVRRAFVVYLASHNRPVHEVLFPALKDLQFDYDNNFKGMTVEPVDLGELVAVRIRLMDDLKHGLDPAERKFFLSLVAAEPDWTLLGLPHLEHLPAIRWKLQNLEKLKKADPRRFAQQSETLASLLA